jgi:hypothetical protein
LIEQIESYLSPHHYDLVTPDGTVLSIKKTSPKKRLAHVAIVDIFDGFIGYQIDPQHVFFNLKSTLAQLGIEGIGRGVQFNRKKGRADVEVELTAYGRIAEKMLELLTPGIYLGKLFAADERRRVRNPDYLLRMFSRSDLKGRPLLSLGGLTGGRELIFEETDGRTIAFIELKEGAISYDDTIYGFLPTLAKSLTINMPQTRQFLHLHHTWKENMTRRVSENEILLVKTAPLHIRTVYARVVNELLPPGYHHTSANVLQPDTTDSGDIYELYGNSQQLIDDIPLEFYTLEPHREHVFFSDRDQLISALEDPEALFKAFSTAPGPRTLLASVFVVKGTQMLSLQAKDWIVREKLEHEFPGQTHPSRQAVMVEKYIESQPQYPFLKAIETGLITSQGVLLSRHFPTPLLKRMLLNDHVARSLKRIYFEYPSLSHDRFFSHEDRAMLLDLAKFGISVYWADPEKRQLLRFVLKPDKDAGLFVPVAQVELFRQATVLGVYGSNLQGSFEKELRELLTGLLAMKNEMHHPLCSKEIPFALLTGGGPGAMEVGNRVAKELGILSCANVVDFRKGSEVVNEQHENRYIEALMTYRLDRLVERQAEFYLDLPIFLPGGIGMDFEYCLEEVRRKIGSAPSNPILLFGSVDYWSRKVSSRFHLNRETGTIAGSEWISNCFYCIQNASQGLAIYRKFFEGKLPIGPKGPIYDQGFCSKF